ncbi:bifunctional ornithine acetyltransferase/N-acetylglutamate synthase [Enemella evansiae]|uniref:bifunctional glutamate N-acetyltransferase/amino-acid acetyltransferase ArgJ n=1 Tax=Enemella evansiae TaxID=2016499 RepID=UPI000B96F859|nr:bifunctional glutamate N-acetyltransferase/amino-acid acetyltransferase ArgJ [Enemella evansiae]OYO20226.1 bifunctional ornithine acetyltransferase/N-acetylglutamate synthase [Enemella evansiae]
MSSGITTPQGFAAAGVTAGLKPSGKSDLALVQNLGPTYAAAAVFTSNRVQAAPVRWSRQVADGTLRAVVLNSGGANACTGEPGMADAARMAELTAAALDCPVEGVAVCSTGLIGERLPMPLLEVGIPAAAAALSTDGGAAAATAIMTTDTVAKQATHTGSGWRIGGMAKGAGMLAPGLATMLVVLTTDAVIDADALQGSLSAACRRTFDRIDSDGCMSTNDSVLLLSSGASGIAVGAEEFTEALTAVCHDLGQQLLTDAEGAAHDIAVEVVGAESETDALEVARSITASNLFKCAIFGRDPNWGRALAALGTTDAAFDPDRVDVSFNGVMVCRAGGIGEDRGLVDLAPRAVHVLVDLHAGSEAATVWTNDLTYDYVKENAEYST